MVRYLWRMIRRWYRRTQFRRSLSWVAFGLLVPALASLLFLFLGYRRERSRLTSEWTVKVTIQPRRDPATIRGLLEGLIEHRSEPAPSFLPESMIDNVACAAAICDAVNFIVGGQRLLRSADAWRFVQVNAAQLEMVYDRPTRYPGDFEVDRVHNRIIEHYDRRIWLSRIVGTVGRGAALTSDGIYLVGYHYRETQSDAAILNAGGTLNSHLLLLLGRQGRWYGYHLYHDPQRPNANPYHVDDLGEELPAQFDLMYVWRVKGIRLGLESRPVRLVTTTRPYQSLNRLVGWMNWTGSARIASFVDSGIMGWFGDEEQYPVIVNTEGGFTDVPSPNLSQHRWRGQVLGLLNGVAIYRHVGADERGLYGLEYECVEFVNRYYASVLHHRNLTQNGNADSYFHDPGPKRLVAFPNGSTTPPEPNDILVFDPDGPGGDPGHVGIVYEVSSTRVCFAQQNMPQLSACLSVRVQNGSWSLSPLANNRPCLGWSRRMEVSHASTQ